MSCLPSCPPASAESQEIHNNRYPMTSEYDWFRFYKWDDEPGGYPCIGSDSCLDMRYCGHLKHVGGYAKAGIGSFSVQG